MTARPLWRQLLAAFTHSGPGYDLGPSPAEIRAAALEEAARALLAVDPVEWALAGQHAGHDAAALLRRMAQPDTTQEQP